MICADCGMDFTKIPDGCHGRGEDECRPVESPRSPGGYKSGSPILISGSIRREEIDEWARKNPEIAYMAMMSIADSLGFPKGQVVNNNLPDSDHQASFPAHTTLDIGTEVIGLDVRMIDKARADL